MPIYEYKCAACGFQKEFLRKLSDAPLKDCPECGKPALSKMVTAAGFQLKGSGWYATDFKHGAKPQAKATDNADAKAETKSEGSAKTETKSDDKAAAKSEAKPATEATTGKAETAAAKPAPAATPTAGS